MLTMSPTQECIT